MRSERVYSLSRELMSKPSSFANTLSDQWAERTLDDSAIRRIDIPETFLLAEAILLGLDNISDGLVVYPKRIQNRVQEELPFMITESVSCFAHGSLSEDCNIVSFQRQAGSLSFGRIQVIFATLSFLPFQVRRLTRHSLTADYHRLL